MFILNKKKITLNYKYVLNAEQFYTSLAIPILKYNFIVMQMKTIRLLLCQHKINQTEATNIDSGTFVTQIIFQLNKLSFI